MLKKSLSVLFSMLCRIVGQSINLKKQVQVVCIARTYNEKQKFFGLSFLMYLKPFVHIFFFSYNYPIHLTLPILSDE